MVLSQSLDNSPSNCNGLSSISVIMSDSGKTLTGSLPETLADGCNQSIIDTRDYDSVVSSSSRESLDDMSLVSSQALPSETLTDAKPVTEIGAKEENEHNLETSGSLPDYPYDHNSFYQSCNCNRKYGLYYGGWPGACGPCCEYRFSPYYRPFISSVERWRYRADVEDMPVGFFRSDLEIMPTGVGAGLYNLGNTCFINAILQCFTHSVPIVEAIRSCNHSMPCQRGVEGFCVFCALRDHIELSLASSGKAISPSRVVENLKHISSCFEKYQQEDAHEFLQCLLDKLERYSLDPDLSDENSSSRENNIVERVFGGRLVSKLRCCNCGHCSHKYERLIDLSLEIEDVETLQSALESFTKVEKIEDVDSKFICDHCKEEVCREKQLMLDQAPSIAALHLKRFKTDGSLIQKIDKHVEFPLELDLKPYTNSNQDCNESQVDLKYQLHAIVVHVGNSPTSGHYFCYVRSSPSTWHKLDDSMVYKVEEEMVLFQSAYILFYVRDGTPWFSSLIEPQNNCLDVNFMSNTSPKSVLDRMETEPAAFPHVENLDKCTASVNQGDVERTSNHFSCATDVDKGQTNETGNDSGGITAPIIYKSRVDGLKLQSDMSSGDIPVNDVSMSPEAGDCHNGILHNENLGGLPSVEENNCGQGADRIGPNDGVTPIKSPRSSPDLNSGGLPETGHHHIRRDKLKAEHSINFRKPKKSTKDQRVEALRYISKNLPSSRGMKLVAAMLPRNDKKRRFRSSPCKQGSPPGSGSKINHHLAVLR